MGGGSCTKAGRNNELLLNASSALHLAFLDLIVEVSFDFHWVSNHNIMTKYPDTWHILTDTTAQVISGAGASNQGGPLAITKLDMQQKSMITIDP